MSYVSDGGYATGNISPGSGLNPAYRTARICNSGCRPDVGHARDTNDFFEVPRNELGPVVGDDPRPRLGVLLLGSFENDLDVGIVVDSRRSQCTMNRR